MTLKRQPWKGRPSRCESCGKDQPRTFYPIEGKYRWEARCDVCNNWVMKSTADDPRGNQNLPVVYV